MQLAIAQNPYTKKPLELWKILDRFDEKEKDEVADGIDTLKSLLGKSGKFKVKS